MARADRMRALGEPWITYFDAAELAGHLAGMGLSVQQDIGPSEIGERWFGPSREDPPRRGGHVVVATDARRPLHLDSRLVVRQLQIWSTVLLGVAIGQAGLGSGFGASLIARDKSELLETLHSVNAIVVIVVAAVCVVLAAVYRRRGGPTWPLVFAVCIELGAILQTVLGELRVVGVHLFLGVLLLCAVTTFCSYAWRHQPSPVPVAS